MKVAVPLLAVLALCGAAWAGVTLVDLRVLLGVALPCAAGVAFLAGFIARVLGWARTPVPFCIPVTCGQQRSLPWVKQSRFDNPSTRLDIVVRIALEVVFFRSLLRDGTTRVSAGPSLSFAPSRLLWISALSLHASLLVIVLRHARFFFGPTPAWAARLAELDGWFAVGIPAVYATSAVFIGALCVLLARRLVSPQLRYLSLPSDFFALFLFLGVGVTGVLMRHVAPVDVVGIKSFVAGLSHGSVASMPQSPVFFVHLSLVSVLAAYFPVSKLMHAPGAMLTPTHALANDSRARRHVNPWNAPVEVHTYAQYESEFRERMKAADLPVDEG